MHQILFKYLENGKDLYQLKKATDGSAGFDLLAAISEEIIIKTAIDEFGVNHKPKIEHLVNLMHNEVWELE